MPPLKRADGTWAKEAAEKDELFADTFVGKYTLPPQAGCAECTLPDSGDTRVLSDFLPVRVRNAVTVLKQL